MPLVVAEIFEALPIGRMIIQVNNRQIPQGFYTGLGIDDVAGTLRIVDKLDKIGPDAVTRMLLEAGRTPEQAAAVLALARIRSQDLSFVEQVRALGVHNGTLDAGLDALSAVIRTGMAHAPGALVADLKIARGLLHRHGLRDAVGRPRVMGLVLFGRSLRRPRVGRAHDVSRGRDLHRRHPTARTPLWRGAAHGQPEHAVGCPCGRHHGGGTRALGRCRSHPARAWHSL